MAKSGNKGNAVPVNDPLDLWRKLPKEAGLELWRDKTPGRDADFEKQVFDRLVAMSPEHSGTASSSVTQLLKRDAELTPPTFSIDHILTAILEAQAGFGAMLRAILETLAQAEANQSGHSLTIRVTERGGESVSMLLDQFRDYVERIEQVTRTYLDHINHGLMRDIEGRLQAVLVMDPDPDLADCTTGQVELRESVGWEAPPRHVVTGHIGLDSSLSLVLEVVAALRTWASIKAPRRDGFQITQFSVDESNIAGYLHNFGDCYVVDLVHTIASRTRNGSLSVQRTIDGLAQLIKILSRRSEHVEQTVKELSDLLRLPVWRHRYELYSVWVGTLLLRTSKQCVSSIEYQTVDGVLSFEFRGSCLATYQYGASKYEIWAELRSDLVGDSNVRKTGIQPDFRVVETSSTGNRNDGTRLVVESKHYLEASIANFVEAANDYARSCSKAHVVVVNHGNGDPAELAKGLETENLERVTFFEKASVDTDRGAALSRKIAEVLFPVPTEVNGELGAELRAIPFDPTRHVAQVAISWTFPLWDVDLSTQGIDGSGCFHEVAYGRMGSLFAPPFALLLGDVTHAPGSEVIQFSGWHMNSYKILVNNYSERGEFTARSIHCSITLNDQTMIVVPTYPIEKTWLVGTIDFDGSIRRFSPGENSKIVALLPAQ